MGFGKYLVWTAAFFTSTASEAREASVDSFNRAAFDAPSQAVGMSLRNHWQLLGSIPPPQLTLTVEPAVVDGSIERPCARPAYTPTWWLGGQLEVRRAAQFEAMVSIACELGIPAALLDAVVAQESGYRPWALSGAGAMGIMQIMPGTASALGLTSPWDAYENMRAGARYLRQQLDRFGRVDLALAAYNAGPERQSLALGRVPAIPETINYVRTITKNWVRLTQLENSGSEALARAAAASQAVRASGYREVSLTFYDGTNSANPI